MDTTSEAPTRPKTLLEAFANTAKKLQQFGIERVRIAGLGTDDRDNGNDVTLGVGTDGIRTITEHDFMREFAFHSRPCIIVDAIDAWPAMRKWREDRYLFDLDGQLPLETERDSSSEEEEEEAEEGEESGEERDMATAKDAADGDADACVEAEREKVRGPKQVTVALTPNGRADATTYVLYDRRDVPEAMRAVTCEDKRVPSIKLQSHPACEASSTNSTINDNKREETADSNLVMEKLFMYAAELKVSLPELYVLLQQSPATIPSPPDPIFIDMRRYKNEATSKPLSDGVSEASSRTPVVAYAQLQNNCLNTEYTHLHGDIHVNVEAFGQRVFGGKPEAANVWFGIPASVSSMHQDWVENLYSVVRGVKEFLLVPPWEGFFIPKPELPAAAFVLTGDPRQQRQDKNEGTGASNGVPPSSVLDTEYHRQCFGQLAFEPYPVKDGSAVPWVDLDFTAEEVEAEEATGAILAKLNAAIDDMESRRTPLDPALLVKDAPEVKAATRRLKQLHPLVAQVAAGETLYLPAMWLHRVGQHADSVDSQRRARHRRQLRLEREKLSAQGNQQQGVKAAAADAAPLPLIAAVNYWYDMSFTNPSVVLLQEFGLLI